MIAVDIETYDPYLKEKGDGSFRCHPDTKDYDGGKLLCCAVYDGTKGECFFPDTPEWSRLERMLADKDLPKVFHNGVYDLSWLIIGAGLEVNGLCHDTMTRASYIDEYQDLDLDACCNRMGVQGKNKEDTIEKWYSSHIEDVRLACAARYRPFKRSDTLWKHSAYLLEHFPPFKDMLIQYNIQDAKATYDLYIAQEPFLHDVYTPYMVDCELMPLVMDMKRLGVLVDRDRLIDLTAEVKRDFNAALSDLTRLYGIDEEILSSPKKLGNRMNRMGAHSPVRTSTGAESWGIDALLRVNHPAVELILEARGYAKLINTYLEGSLSDTILSDGRIHCTFTPNKRDDGGTVTGRFSCSKPNLQQIPARDKAVGHSYGQAMRSLFLPERGCMISALDYSQIEYLLLAHFAVGPQAAWLREQAMAGVDFHTAAMSVTGIPSRQVVKTFNYGVIYGMGWYTAMVKNWTLFEKQAFEKGETIDQYTKEIYNNYHERLPVIRATMNKVQNDAKRLGYVVTLGGRKLHTPKARYDKETGKWNDYLYKMLNKLIQGSAADILKFSLLEAYRAGVFNTLKMHLTVHDENVVSVPYNKEGAEANGELQHIMEAAFKDVLHVPMKAACELGPNWGYWSSDIWSEMKSNKFREQTDCWWEAESKTN